MKLNGSNRNEANALSPDRLLWSFFLTILSACNGSEKTNSVQDLDPSHLSPVIIRNFEAAAEPFQNDSGLVSQYIRSIFQDSKGNMWFGTLGDGVVRYDIQSLTYFSSHNGFHCDNVCAISEDKSGSLWFGTDQGVYRYDGKTFRNFNQDDGLSQIEISRKGILVDRLGVIWVGTHDGVFRYDPTADSLGSQSFSLFQQLQGVDVAGILEDANGNIWFASPASGVFQYDGAAVTNIAQREGLGNNYAGGMAQDNAGNMWFTMRDGICKFDGKSFTDYFNKDGLCGTEFWGIYIEQSGIIWVTARGCTTRFDPSVTNSNLSAFTVFTEDDGINCCVQSMYQDRSGQMWWGAGSGLYRFDGKRFFQVKQNGPW